MHNKIKNEEQNKIESANQIEFAKEFAIKKFKEAGVGNHWPDVLAVLQDEFNIDDPDILIAAILHDTLEDTETTYEELVENFSKPVADLVEEVSHPKNYSGVQKVEYYEKLKHISQEGKIIKLADFKSHLPKFIGAFTGEGDYHIKETDDRYVKSIRSFLEHCDDSNAKNIVAGLTDELNDYILGNKK